tara:strand:- start:15358 stop:15540 length:183 start_codon:yes stop_codon:yes gene_type:complete
VKPGDLVRNKSSESGMLGIFLEWKTFDEKSNPYTCPIVWWKDGRQSSIQYGLLELVSEVD